MIGVFVTFRHVDDFNEQMVRKIAEGARARFEGMPGLRSKASTLNPDTRVATNFYVWDSEEAANAFFTEELLHRVDESLRSSSEHRVRADRYARGKPPLIGPVFASFRTMLSDSVG